MATPSELEGIDGSKVSLNKSEGRGPHGIGDPEDQSLRRVEKEIMIPQKMKLKAKEQKCASEVKGFGICAKEQGLLMPFKCRQEAEHLRLCLEAAYKDKEFVDTCTQEYLKERTEYRRTGIKTNKTKKSGS